MYDALCFSKCDLRDWLAVIAVTSSSAIVLLWSAVFRPKDNIQLRSLAIQSFVTILSLCPTISVKTVYVKTPVKRKKLAFFVLSVWK
jgi:hypothetical protein